MALRKLLFQSKFRLYKEENDHEYDTRKIAELSRIIFRHISRDLNSDLRERMVDIVGGQVLELQEERWLKQGYEEGEKQGFLNGEKQGRDSLLYSLVMDNVLTVSDTALRAGKDEKQFIKDMKAYLSEQKKASSDT